MALSREQRTAFRLALMSAFPDPSDLRLFLLDAFGVELNQVTSVGWDAYPNVVLDLIRWAESDGKAEELLAQAVAAKPGNPDLAALSAATLAAMPPPATAPPAASPMPAPAPVAATTEPVTTASPAPTRPPARTPSRDPSSTDYVDVHVLLERDGDRYRARVVQSRGGTTDAVSFKTPMTPEALAAFRAELQRPMIEQDETPKALEKAKAVGGRLYRAVFQGEVERALTLSERAAKDTGTGLRIRMHVDKEAPELVELPWEFLYDQGRDRWLTLSTTSSVVRFLDINDAPAPHRVEGSFRVLVVISKAGEPPLDVDGEWKRISETLAALAPKVEVTPLMPATLDALEDALQQGEYHLLHFVGHGGFDPATGGVLLLERADGTGSVFLSADKLRVLAPDSLRLVVLNSCQGSMTSERDPFAGVAQAMLRRGIPAVVGMQFEVSDGAAVRFSQTFYRSIVAGDPVDVAMAHARQSLFVRADGFTVGPLEWGTPALYQLVDDGRIFDVVAS